MAVEDAVTEVAVHDGVRGGPAHLQRELLEDLLGDGAIVERVDLQQPVAGDHDGVLARGRPRRVHDGQAADPVRRQVLEHLVLQRIVAEHGREHHVAPGRAQVLGHDGGAAREVLLGLEPHAHGRRLRHPADHAALGVAVDDRVADDVHADAG